MNTQSPPTRDLSKIIAIGLQILGVVLAGVIGFFASALLFENRITQLETTLRVVDPAVKEIQQTLGGKDVLQAYVTQAQTSATSAAGHAEDAATQAGAATAAANQAKAQLESAGEVGERIAALTTEEANQVVSAIEDVAILGHRADLAEDGSGTLRVDELLICWGPVEFPVGRADDGLRDDTGDLRERYGTVVFPAEFDTIPSLSLSVHPTGGTGTGWVVSTFEATETGCRWRINPHRPSGPLPKTENVDYSATTASYVAIGRAAASDDDSTE